MVDGGGVDGTTTTGSDSADPAVSTATKIEGGATGERLVFFTDAVTAISITLLVLPLVDLVREVAADNQSASSVITGHFNQVWSFLLSFLVIANVWREHHRAFSSLARVTRPLTIWNMLWLLSVVVLPLPAEMIGTFGRGRFVAAFYYGTILATMICRFVMLRIVKTTPALLDEDDPAAIRRIGEFYTESYLNVIAMVVALALALAVPVLQYYSLVLLIVPRRLHLLGRLSAH